MRIGYIHLLLIGIYALPAYSDQYVKQQLETLYATSHLLTQSDAVTIGYGHFDPIEFINPSFKRLNENDDIDFKQQLNVFSLPFSTAIESPSAQITLSITGKLSYLEKKQSINLFNSSSDKSKDYLYNASLGLQAIKSLSKNWVMQSNAQLQLMHYENKFMFNSPLSKNRLAPLIDNESVNISSNALLINPTMASIYTLPTDWGKYEFKTDLSYFYGHSFAQSDSLPVARPEGWHIINGVKAKFDLGYIVDVQPAFYLKAQRVDLAADSKAAFEVDHFYEYGMGVLFDVSPYTSWFTNFGIGINIHTGSVLEGGSIVFYFDEF